MFAILNFTHHHIHIQSFVCLFLFPFIQIFHCLHHHYRIELTQLTIDKSPKQQGYDICVWFESNVNILITTA